MREESHLEDMRAAIRGDFERLAERQGDQELMRVVAVRRARVADGAASSLEPEPEPEPEPTPARERSWLARFLSP